VKRYGGGTKADAFIPPLILYTFFKNIPIVKGRG
jgi:hypothetical protein